MLTPGGSSFSGADSWRLFKLFSRSASRASSMLCPDVEVEFRATVGDDGISFVRGV